MCNNHPSISAGDIFLVDPKIWNNTESFSYTPGALISFSFDQEVIQENTHIWSFEVCWSGLVGWSCLRGFVSRRGLAEMFSSSSRV